MYYQSDLIARAGGTDNETIARNEALMKSIFSIVKEEHNNTKAGEKLSKLLHDEMANVNEDEKQHSGYSEAKIDAQIHTLLSPCMRFFLTYDPKPTLMEVKCPILAIN